MNTALWIAQGVLAAMFLMSGSTKTFQTKEKMAEKIPWVSNVSITPIRLLGITQLLAAAGLILPGLTGILPVLTPLAAVGLCITMASAAVFHLRRAEYSSIGINAFLLALSAFVVYGRL
jgi:uncharacterized membrane protein YphA (DoxX/SURF4 family)